MSRHSNKFRVHTCRACAGRVDMILDLGQSPVANDLLEHADSDAPLYDLGLVSCVDCGLVQNVTNLPTHVLFNERYPYFSGVSATVRRHADDLARQIAQCAASGSLALELGSNDGTTQLALARHGIKTVGVDPSQGPVEAAQAAGCDAHCGVLDARMMDNLRTQYGQFDLATMSNILAHVPEPAALLTNVHDMLVENGLLVIEVQSWLDLAHHGAFDMVYHEHHSHFDLASLAHLLELTGFGIERVRHVAAQGGSLRVFCRKGRLHSDAATELIAQSTDEIARAPETLRAHVAAFQRSAERFGEEMADKQIAGYGAAAKTVTLLAAMSAPIEVNCVADRAPSKIGKYLPIGRIPIVSPQQMLGSQPDIIVLFAWNLQKEIVPQLQGADVWVPMPQFSRVT